VVIDGNCRDVDEIHDLGLPIIARGAVPLTARRRYIEQSSGEPVRIGGVEVRQGDFMLADSTGLVFISLKHIDGVLANAERVIAKEALMAKDIADGVAPSTVLDTSYEELLDDEEEGLNAF
jgi:regulator of RNase E activity RraA